jgi:Glyoxalase/Bleomycin resistance protein/Dioxygenase superfamily
MFKEPYFHVGIVVKDLEQAMTDMGLALGLSWASIRTLPYREGSLRLTCSRQGPPHLELFQSLSGSHWDASNGSRIDHLGFWSDDLEAGRRHMLANGMSVCLDGTTIGWNFIYFDNPHGLRIELADVRRRPAVEEWLSQ